MKKIKYIFVFLFVFLITSCTKTPTESISTSMEENKIERIEAINTEDEYCYVGDIYKPSIDVEIDAIYTNEKRENVTSYCHFSSISTESTGTRVLKVTYENFITTYNVRVKNPDVSYISLNTSNVKCTYKLGEPLDLTNLEVIAYFVNNKHKIVTNYTYIVTDEYNEAVMTSSLDKVGKLDVEIKYEDKRISFPILCIGNYDQTYTMRFQALNDLYDTLSGSYKFNEEVNVMRSPYLTFNSTKDTSLVRVDSNQQSLNEEYNNVEYFEAIKINKDNGLDFTLSHDAIISFLVKAEEISKLLISEKSSAETQKTIFTSISINNKLNLISVYLKQGIYNISSNKNNMYLFESNVYLYDSNIDIIHTYKSIELVTENVKKEFIDEAFNSTNLYVKGIYDINKFDNITSNDYKIELVYKDVVYDSFKFSGTYTVNVIYQGINPSFEYVANYEVEYTNSRQLQKNQFEYLRINGKDVVFGTTPNTDIIGNVEVENTNKVSVSLNLIDNFNSVCIIDGKQYSSGFELDVVSGNNMFEFSVEYKDQNNKTVYYIKYQINILVK